ncbi:MAG TPA: sulfotransferase [Bacteroidia bacterium]
MLPIEEIEKLPFLFIVGRARSGTTLLQTMLDANPHVMLPFESRLIIFLKKKYFPVKIFTAKLADEFINDLYKEREFRRSWNVNRDELQKAIHSFPLHKLSFGVLCKLVYLSYPSPFEKTNLLLIGDKKPTYSKFIKELREVFPQAKFIHLIRDYRDNILSNREAFTLKNISILAHNWNDFNSCIDQVKAQHKELFYTLRYEDLVALPERYSKEICAFVGIPFYPEMLNTHTKVNEVYDKTTEEGIIKQAIIKVHANLLNPINTRQIDKWKQQLSQDEIALADYICGRYAQQYKYQSVSNEKGMALWVKSFLGKSRLCFDDMVIKTYYQLPFGFRNAISYVTAKLYQKFGFTTYYNHNDFMFKKRE